MNHIPHDDPRAIENERHYKHCLGIQYDGVEKPLPLPEGIVRHHLGIVPLYRRLNTFMSPAGLVNNLMWSRFTEGTLCAQQLPEEPTDD